jgi:hypothetical protein
VKTRSRGFFSIRSPEDIWLPLGTVREVPGARKLPGSNYTFLELMEVLCKLMYIPDINPRNTQGDTRGASVDPETRSWPLRTAGGSRSSRVPKAGGRRSLITSWWTPMRVYYMEDTISV